MHLRNVVLAILVVATVAFAQVQLDSPYQVRYATNYSVVDSTINIINDGANGNVNPYGPSFGGTGNGSMCVNVYAFDPQEELLSCCSCIITPDQVVTLSVQAIMANLLTPEKPTSVTIKLVGSNGGSATFAPANCTNEAAQVGVTTGHTSAGGYVAFGTTAHAAGSGALQLTETPFIPAVLSASELTSLTTRCSSIIGNGSKYGQCPNCTAGVWGLQSSNRGTVRHGFALSFPGSRFSRLPGFFPETNTCLGSTA